MAMLVDQAHLADKTKGAGMGGELVGALAALFCIKDETMLLNGRVAELAWRRESADKASFYLDHMQGAHDVVSSHCEFVAHCSATCRLPEGPGTWSQGKNLKVLLLRGTRRQLLFYTEALGVSGTSRTCLLKVDMSSVISISEPQESDSTAPVADTSKASLQGAMQEAAGVRETYTMTLQLRSQDGSSNTADPCMHDKHGAQTGKMVTSVLTLSPPLSRSGGAWLGGALVQVGAALKAPGALEIEGLRHLVLSARLLMQDEEAKRLSVSLERHVSFT